MKETEEGERVAAEIRLKIDGHIAEQPKHPDTRTVEDFDSVQEFLDYLGSGSAEAAR
jgi:hypothetical protein